MAKNDKYNIVTEDSVTDYDSDENYYHGALIPRKWKKWKKKKKSKKKRRRAGSSKKQRKKEHQKFNYKVAEKGFYTLFDTVSHVVKKGFDCKFETNSEIKKMEAKAKLLSKRPRPRR